MPANLQGKWNDKFDPPWGSKYTININTENIRAMCSICANRLILRCEMRRYFFSGLAVPENQY